MYSDIDNHIFSQGIIWPIESSPSRDPLVKIGSSILEKRHGCADLFHLAGIDIGKEYTLPVAAMGKDLAHGIDDGRAA